MTAGATRRLRIGIGAPYDLSRDGGVNTHIRAQAAALRAAGHSVLVFGASSAPLTDGEVSLGGCVSFVIGGTQTAFGIDPRLRGRTIALFNKHRFDIVHLHEPLMPLASWFALRHAPAPIVATFHVHREQGHVWYPRARWLLAPLMGRVQARVAVSDAARRTVARHFPGEYEVVPNGIDVQRFQHPAAGAQVFADGPNVLCVGRLEPRKGVRVLIDAMALVQQRHNRARLIVVGDGPERSALESAATAHGIQAHFAGRVPDQALPAYYRAADIVCSVPSGGESFGIVLLEGMAAGRAVVGTRIDGYTELLGGTDSAELVPPGNVPALADAISELLKDSDRRQTLGRRGAAFVQQFDWSAIVKRLEAIYTRAVVSGQKEYGNSGLNASDASDRFERPFTR